MMVVEEMRDVKARLCLVEDPPVGEHRAFLLRVKQLMFWEVRQDKDTLFADRYRFGKRGILSKASSIRYERICYGELEQLRTAAMIYVNRMLKNLGHMNAPSQKAFFLMIASGL